MIADLAWQGGWTFTKGINGIADERRGKVLLDEELI